MMKDANTTMYVPKMTTIAVGLVQFSRLQAVKAKRFAETGKMPSTKSLVDEALSLLAAQEGVEV